MGALTLFPLRGVGAGGIPAGSSQAG